MLKVFTVTALSLCVLQSRASAQACTGGPVSGVVRDTTDALVPGATISVDGNATRTSGPDGRFRFPCVALGKHTLTASLQDFAPNSLSTTVPHSSDLTFHLVPSASANIDVEADEAEMQVEAPGGGNGTIVAGKQLQSLADDPDDLLRELQQLSAANGGSPGRATISVDGFSDGATLPPKDSIAFVNVSPDLFSAEYREPPFGGGRVEVYTKPGAKSYHGALFTTNSSSWMNARDPFTTTLGSVGKQRYGFDFTGPIRKQGSNFSLNLEHRSIDETVAVNAITLDASGQQVNTQDTVPNPQRLWIGNARMDWQLGPKNIASISYSANWANLKNQGVGGQTLREAGHDVGRDEQVVRISNVTTVSPRLVHEARFSVDRFVEGETPASNLPSLQVAGYFSGGGSALGRSHTALTRYELDDDIILNTKRHLIKAGAQFFFVHRYSDMATGFNGTYVFAGHATGNPATSITAIDQYRNARNSAGDSTGATSDTATEFTNVAGIPRDPVSQWRNAFFYQDNFKLNTKWTMVYGLRYYFQTQPANYNGVAPRTGFSYSPDKKQTWVIKSHFGLFDGQVSADLTEELYREDGVKRVTSLIYNSAYCGPNASSGCSPFTNATPIHSQRTLAPGFHNTAYAIGDFSVSKDLPHGFNINAQEVLLRFINNFRTVNINQPLTPDPHGPRPIAPNLNILQVQDTGGGQGHGEFFGISNFRLKRTQFFLGVLHLNLRDDTDDSFFFQPQSAYSDAGETVNRSSQGIWQLFGNSSVSLPYKFSLTGNGYATGGQPLNITTGADNNGDGSFNDRPQYAPAGSAANGTTIFNTPFGLLTNSGAIVNGIPAAAIRRNIASLPWTFHIDANLQRAFKLTRDAKSARQQTITVNMRSANFINHTNVTGESTVLGSPQFLRPITADTARRLEFGLRYSF